MLQHSALGKAVSYAQAYTPTLLFAIPRALGRAALGLTAPLPFFGVDIWRGYELSWLNSRGKPIVALAEFRIPADSPALVESKSFKLYLNSLNGTRFASSAAVQDALRRDIGRAVGAPIAVQLLLQGDFPGEPAADVGTCIDDLDLEVQQYALDPTHLCAGAGVGEAQETLYSDLLKSNCPVTGQPDWARLTIRYAGARLDRLGLLRYIVSFREHSEFHELCAERIFVDIMHRCRPQRLSVHACYIRRGGLEINPFRSNFEQSPVQTHHPRQ